MPNIKEVPKWIWATIVGVGTVAGLLTTMFTLWNAVENKIEGSIKQQTVLIIQELDNRTGDLAELQKDDLWDRIVLLELEIKSLEDTNQYVPERLRIHLRDMKERFEEVKERWQD